MEASNRLREAKSEQEAEQLREELLLLQQARIALSRTLQRLT
jgi:hypothetical protein